MERLARERDVIAVDLPGFGHSPGLVNGDLPTPHALAGSVGGLLDRLGIRRAHVAGNSLGGWVALELAKAGRALSAAGLCTAGLWARPLGPRPGRDPRGVGRRLLPVLPALLRSPGGRRMVLRGSVAHPERVPPEAAARLVRSYLTSTGYESANEAMRASVFSGFEDIRVPVTLAWARHGPGRAQATQDPAGVAHDHPPRLRAHPDLGRPQPGRPHASAGQRLISPGARAPGPREDWHARGSRGGRTHPAAGTPGAEPEAERRPADGCVRPPPRSWLRSQYAVRPWPWPRLPRFRRACSSASSRTCARSARHAASGLRASCR